MFWKKPPIPGILQNFIRNLLEGLDKKGNNMLHFRYNPVTKENRKGNDTYALY